MLYETHLESTLGYPSDKTAQFQYREAMAAISRRNARVCGVQGRCCLDVATDQVQVSKGGIRYRNSQSST